MEKQPLWNSKTLQGSNHLVCQFQALVHILIIRHRVLSSLGTLTKSACQLILQTSIMMVTWHLEDTKTLLHVYRTANIIFSAMMLARSATINHYFVSSGKNVQGKVAILKQKTRRKMFQLKNLSSFPKSSKDGCLISFTSQCEVL